MQAKPANLVRSVISFLLFSYIAGLLPLRLGGAFTPEAQAKTSSGGTDVVTITAPLPNNIITDFSVLVRGTLTVPSGTEVGVTVNGFPGLVDLGPAPGRGSKSPKGHKKPVTLPFAALVPLEGPVTSLTATATDATGTPLGSATLPVSAEPPTKATFFFQPSPAMRVVARRCGRRRCLCSQSSPAMGVAPLPVTFTLTSLKPIALIKLDLQGDGVPDFQGTALNDQEFTYDRAGLYVPTVTAVDTDGTPYTATALVQALPLADLDARLQAKWSAMKAQLRSGNIPGALQYIRRDRRAACEQILTDLTVPLPSIDQVLTDIRFVKLTGSSVEYEMLRTDRGTTLSYPVLFTLDEDGIWRIKFFYSKFTG